MKNNKNFEQCIIDAYQSAAKAVMEDSLMGIPFKKKSIYGRIYYANSSPSFTDIQASGGEQAIHSLLKNYNSTPDMLYLLSRKDGTEAQIYEWEYVGHEVKEDSFIVHTKTETYCFVF